MHNDFMKQGVIVAAVLAACVLLIAYLFMHADSTRIVTSQDGAVELSIPKSALPDKTDEVSVVLLADKDFWGETNEVPGPAYRLLPDGLAFTEPVTLTYRGKGSADGGSIPVLLHASTDGETEVLVPKEFTLDASTGSYAAVFEITHFSDVGVDRFGIFDYTLSSGGRALIGRSIPFRLDIRPNTSWHWFDLGYGYSPNVNPDRYTAKGHYYWIIPGSRYTVSDFDIHADAGVLSPAVLIGQGRQHAVTERYSLSSSFMCEREGSERPSAVIGPRIDFSIGERRQTSRGDITEATANEYTSISLHFGEHVCEKGMEYVGAQYFIVCPDGTTLSGYPRRDKDGNEVTDASGNQIDSITGQPVVCPSVAR